MATDRDFDWVTTRASCSVQGVFALLLLETEKDVKRRNSLLGAEKGFRFEFEGTESSFQVSKIINGLSSHAYNPKSVQFSVNGESIAVSGSVKAAFSATVALNNDGDCRLKIGDEELMNWQFRMRALQELFF